MYLIVAYELGTCKVHIDMVGNIGISNEIDWIAYNNIYALYMGLSLING